jgi:hypothetical protein
MPNEDNTELFVQISDLLKDKVDAGKLQAILQKVADGLGVTTSMASDAALRRRVATASVTSLAKAEREFNERFPDAARIKRAF